MKHDYMPFEVHGREGNNLNPGELEGAEPLPPPPPYGPVEDCSSRCMKHDQMSFGVH